MSYTILWCKQPNSNEPWVMECGVKGFYPTRKAAMDVIRKKFNSEIDDDVKRSLDDWEGATEDMIRGMTINDWMISESRSSMSWMRYGEPYPVMYKVVKIPTERKKK
jgi:hypothetical protein